MDRRAIAQAIEDRADYLGMPWSEVARRAGLSTKAIEDLRFERRDARLTTLEKISTALNLDPDALTRIGAGEQVDLASGAGSIETRVASLEDEVRGLRDEVRGVVAGVEEIKQLLNGRGP